MRKCVYVILDCHRISCNWKITSLLQIICRMWNVDCFGVFFDISSWHNPLKLIFFHWLTMRSLCLCKLEYFSQYCTVKYITQKLIVSLSLQNFRSIGWHLIFRFMNEWLIEISIESKIEKILCVAQT